MKTMLILVDGMRPDALRDIPKAQAVLERSTYTLEAQTVFPPVTLPCHMSLFHSVDPSRHGTTTNIYAPQVRPIDGLCEVLKSAKLKTAFFFNWEELRDIARPASLWESYCVSGDYLGWEPTNAMIMERALADIEYYEIDFAFVYLGWVDGAGHNFGWMTDEYTRAVRSSWDDITTLIERFADEYRIIILADHGGHDRTHGAPIPEDMTIPLILLGPEFEKGKVLQDASIKDVAPTIAALFGLSVPKEWEGKSLYIPKV